MCIPIGSIFYLNDKFSFLDLELIVRIETIYK